MPVSPDPPSASFWPRANRSRAIDRDLHCTACGYNLRGLAAPGNCPECGRAFHPELMTTPGLPWGQRATRGRMEAFLATLHRVLLRPPEFAAELWESGHLSRTDAVRFRRLCLLCAFLPMVAVWLAFVPAVVAPKAPAIGAVTGPVVLALWLEWSSTRLPSLMRRQTMNKHRHRRVITLAHYTAAPLALTPVVTVALTGLLLLTPDLPANLVPLAYAAGAGVLLAFVTLWQLCPVLFLYNTMAVTPAEALALLLVAAVGFLTRTAVCLGLIPSLVRWWTDGHF